MNDKHLNCVLIGEGSLLIHCADILLAQGHSIKLTIAQNPAIIEWCNNSRIEHIAPDDDLIKNVTRVDMDYLFSITNLAILPAPVILQPKRAAINFHDGPLPDYAGLNTPAWALLDGARKYGVTWHCMTADVDQGDILKQKHFPIVANETVLTLNTKCYEAGAEAFAELLGELAEQRETRTPQTRKPVYFRRNQRPAAACRLDWTHSAEQLAALVRALDYGPYFNSMGRAKLFLGDEHVLVSSATILDGSAAPGTICAADPQSLTIACADGALRCFGLLRSNGGAIDAREVLAEAGLAPGDHVADTSASILEAISELNKQVCPNDEFWVSRLSKSTPFEVPNVWAEDGDSQQSGAYSTVHVPSPKAKKLPDDTISSKLAAISLVLGRLGSCTETLDIAYANTELRQRTAQTLDVFSRWLPLHIEIDYQQSFESLGISIGRTTRLLDSKKSFARDLYTRHPDLRNSISCEAYPVACLTGVAADDFTPGPEHKFSLIFCVTEHGLSIHHGNTLQLEQATTTIVQSLAALTRSVQDFPDLAVARHGIVSAADLRLLLGDWISKPVTYDTSACLHHLFEHQAATTPDKVALDFAGQQLSYGELNDRANRLARLLQECGSQQEDRIGVLMDRSLNMVVVLYAVLKAGCAYVPLDSRYPPDRLAFVLEDSGASIVVTLRQHAGLQHLCKARLLALDAVDSQLSQLDGANLDQHLPSSALAYVIYTSGSTGKPKGVMVEHRNVTNFICAMDERIGTAPGVWLAVTSISFDISVLELFWTLTRGFKVVLYADSARQQTTTVNYLNTSLPSESIDFSLFYWNVASPENESEQQKYRLLLESARYGDANSFTAVWTPERHFSAFGGLYPNPSVISAALATITDTIQLRAGSCVVPLHSPIRIAEEWAVVDNLSNGRVGLSIAAGWAPPDFAIKPENFANAKNIMFESVETVQRLWRGETVEMPGPEPDKPIAVRTLPRPLQKELPVWVTTAGNIATFLKAAEIGANILTHLLGQSVEEVGEKIAAYREAWKEHGHAGEGHVTLMLHTFVGPDAAKVKDIVRQPMKTYLQSAMFLVKDAAWQFPTFKKFSDEQGKNLDEFFETISDEDMDALLEFSFLRYYGTSGLFGTADSCMPMVEEVRAIGVNEIGCLIDFGAPIDVVLEHLPYLNQLRQLANSEVKAKASETTDIHDLADLMQSHQVTHFQCTPSMATTLCFAENSKKALGKLCHIMIGGEAFPPVLANDLQKVTQCRVTNMYGPTETTIWSSTQDLDESYRRTVPIGTAVANTRLYVVDQHQQPLPIGVPGEIAIGGDGVARGYHNREKLTAERFVASSLSGAADRRLYLTGDLGRFRSDGRLECLGRMDDQIKIRGYRVELGEIETVIREHESVLECAVILREDRAGDQRLAAYVQATPGHAIAPTVLRAHIGQSLPEHMLPQHVVVLESLPLTGSGKIDRKALPKPEATFDQQALHVEPGSELEIYLAKIWREVLEVETLGITDDFFALGGHSLLAIRLVSTVAQDLGVKISLRLLFENPCIADLAREVEALLVAEIEQLSDAEAERLLQAGAD